MYDIHTTRRCPHGKLFDSYCEPCEQADETENRRRKSIMSEHYTDGRRYSHISNAWILDAYWNDRETVAAQESIIANLQKERAMLTRDLSIEVSVSTSRFQQCVALKAQLADLQAEAERMNQELEIEYDKVAKLQHEINHLRFVRDGLVQSFDDVRKERDQLKSQLEALQK